MLWKIGVFHHLTSASLEEVGQDLPVNLYLNPSVRQTQKDIKMDRRMDRQTQTNIKMDGQTDSQTDRQTDMDGWKDR
jgi:hypothetical protein